MLEGRWADSIGEDSIVKRGHSIITIRRLFRHFIPHPHPIITDPLTRNASRKFYLLFFHGISGNFSGVL